MKTRVIVYLFTCLTFVLPVTSEAEVECRVNGNSTNSINLFINSKRNQTGEWVTSFSVDKGDSGLEPNNNVTLSLSQGVTECKGKKTVNIKGVLSGISSSISQMHDSEKDILLFHSKCGSNVAVLNDGRTARKINFEESGHSVVFTNRPLKINERLEVKLEKKLNKYNHCLAIGVTTATPMSVAEYPQHINSIKNRSWAYYISNTYFNGDVHLKNYGKSLNILEVGERAAVMVSNTGTLHFYWNGEDQGPAASNIPHPVYGVVELYDNAAMVSIV